MIRQKTVACSLTYLQRTWFKTKYKILFSVHSHRDSYKHEQEVKTNDKVLFHNIFRR